MSSFDFMNVCRLCLAKDGHLHPIFGGESEVPTISLKITSCLPVKIAREDKLPQKICEQCLYKLDLSYEFWNLTVETEKQLLQWLSGVNSQNYAVTTILNQDIMKGEQSNENRLDGSMMQQVSGHQNSMNMGIDNMCISMIMPNNNQQQITSVPIDTSGSSVQNVQVIAGSSTQTTHDQITQSQTNVSTQQEEEEESSEDEENSDDECDGDEGLPIKEESEEDPNNSRTIEPTTFVNVSLHCDEAGPSGIRQQKITDIQEMTQATDVDPKTGFQLLQINDIKIESSHMSHAFLARMSANAGVAGSLGVGKDNKRAMRKSPRLHYACDICTFFCRTKGSLRKHAQLHRNTCRICGERFVATDKLEIHMVLNHGEAKYSCQLCYTVTWNVPDMTEHFSARHLDSTHNNCSICNKEYRSKIGIQRHMYKHHCSVSVACTICRRIYKSVSALKTHTRLVHLKSGYQCGICKRRVATAASLEAHMRRHENTGQPTNPETYVCTTCGESFLNKRDLKSHVVSHGRIKPHVCPVCRKAFEERRVQVQHILTHMNTPLYVCDVCGMKYSRRATLVRHRSTHPGPLGALPEIPVTDIVTEFVKNYLNESKNMANS